MALDAKRAFTTVMVCATALACTQLVASAGDLTPPGAPAPTMKTLDEVEARIPIGPLTTPGDADSIYRITQPGSYYLTGPVNGVTGKHGIEIGVGDVALDLNGYALIGVLGTFPLSAIAVEAGGLANIEVRNGSVSTWYGGGIHGPDAVAMHISDVSTYLLLADAAFLAGPSATIADCSASYSSGGFVVGTNSVIERCVAEATVNLSDGFIVGSGTRVSRSVASNGTAAGFVASDGGAVASGCAFIECTATGNTEIGFVTGRNAIVEIAASHGNSVGFQADQGTLLRGCTAAGNDVNGFSCGADVVVRDSVASGNGAHGFALFSGCVLADSVARENGGAIAVGAGVIVSGGGNHIEGNSVASNDYGFDIDGTGNVLIRNRATGNADNYGQIVGGNYVGTVVLDAAGMNAAANSNVNLEF